MDITTADSENSKKFQARNIILRKFPELYTYFQTRHHMFACFQVEFREFKLKEQGHLMGTGFFFRSLNKKIRRAGMDHRGATQMLF